MFKFVQKIIDKFYEDNSIPNPPYDYDFILSLSKEDYPKYLKKFFKFTVGETLNLEKPKTFNEKIQWLKLYDTTPIKTQLTDKVLVRNWIKEKIGEEYLKPVLWIGNSFDEIPFENLPDSFIIKTNHGCKWHAKIKDKKKLLENEKLYIHTKNKFNNWLKQTFFPFAGFELQYKNIKPLLLIEPIMGNNDYNSTFDIEIMCFNGVPKLFKVVNYEQEQVLFDINELNLQEITALQSDIYKYEFIKRAVDLSYKLAEEFKLVRVDWFVDSEKIYFNEMTFTPCSGFYQFNDKSYNVKLGNMLKL